MKAGVNAGRIITGVNRQLSRIIGNDTALISKLKTHVLESGGKRIRPLLLYYLSLLYGKSDSAVLKLGAILEIVHSASLLHDDVIDNADDRRGKPSGRKLFGNKTVVLGGDYLLSCGLSALNDFNDSRLMSVFTQVIKDLAIAELAQMSLSGKKKVHLTEYLSVIEGKTASLFRAAGETAWYYAKPQEYYKKSFMEIAPARLGYLLGMYFQIRDDILDYFAPEVLAKKGMQDYRNGLVTFPLLIAEKNVALSRKLSSFMSLTVQEKISREGEFKDFLREEKIDIICENYLHKQEKELEVQLNKIPNGLAREQILIQLKKLQVQLPI